MSYGFRARDAVRRAIYWFSAYHATKIRTRNEHEEFHMRDHTCVIFAMQKLRLLKKYGKSSWNATERISHALLHRYNGQGTHTRCRTPGIYLRRSARVCRLACDVRQKSGKHCCGYWM